MLIHNPKIKSVAVIERVGPGYVTSTVPVYRVKRAMPSGMYLLLAAIPVEPASVMTIAVHTEDRLANAIATVHDGGLVNVPYITDRDDSTYAYTTSTLAAGSELPLVTYDLGSPMVGIVFVRYLLNVTNAQLRVNTSGDGTTWFTYAFPASSSATNGAFYTYATSMPEPRYVRVSLYNSGTAGVALTESSFRLFSLEFYPNTNRTKLVGDNSVKTVTVFVSYAFYQLLEVWEF